MYYIAHVSDIMSKNVITTTKDTPLLEVAKIFESYKFNGIPVLDEEKKLIGIVTQYDVITKMASLFTGKKEEADPKKLLKLTAADVMNAEAVTLPESATLEEALKSFSEHHRVSSIPVIDTSRRVVGVISRFDVLRSFNDFQTTS